jgi:L-seryl-tRNA(Ser) seleniumtransferase
VEEAARSYVNLELDIASGRRGRRASAIVAALCDLTGAEDALIVNNGAAAALLAASALAGPDRAIAVSRGELIEIGGGFRVPEVVAQSGARLVEVGTTNRTRLSDYQAALAAGADVVLHVHQSNFRAVGFVERVEIESLCALGAPVIDDVGSGALVDIAELADEPQVARSVAAGAAVVCFSGDKLLGGPQAGVMVGTDSAIGACRRHPLARALRAGRLTLSALEATLALYRDPERALREIPVLAMLTADEAELRRRADQFAAAVGGSVVEASARVGGGALPLLELRGPAVALETDEEPGRVAAALRAADPPLIGRIAAGRVLIDPRTLQDDELELAATVTREALRRRS